MIFCNETSAVTVQEFCESYHTLNEVEVPQKGHLRKALTILFNPKKLILPISSLDQNLEKVIKSSTHADKKIIFINMPTPLFDEKVIKDIQIQQKEIQKLTIYKDLKEAKTLQDCLHIVKNNTYEFDLLEIYIENFQQNQKKIDAQKQSIMNRQILKNLNPFKKIGWQIHFTKNLFEMFDIIENEITLTEMMIITHSDVQGRIYDAEKNIYPKKAFSNLPERIKKIIMYSCHSKEVASYYGINQRIDHFEYIYPVIKKEFEEIFHDKIPVIALKGMLPSASTSHSLKNKSSRKCSLLINHASDKNHVLIILNDQFVGLLNSTKETHLNLYCDLLNQTKNVVKIFYLNQKERLPLDITSIALKTSEQEFFDLSIKNYQSSQSNYHLLTTGTIGGIP
jgi:hypothetical protein